jgi:hypothetical protein
VEWAGCDLFNILRLLPFLTGQSVYPWSCIRRPALLLPLNFVSCLILFPWTWRGA